MRLSVLLFALIAWPFSSWAQTVPETRINHAWVDGVYSNQDELPNWGFFADVVENFFFGAIYGYDGGDATFITLQGTLLIEDPLVFSGDVYRVTNSGASVTDVGNFTWDVGYFEGSPAASLTISSHILNATDLPLFRLIYAEIDKVDMFTAADWNIITRVLDDSFAYHFGITDDRVVEDGITYALVVNHAEPGEIGAIGYFPPAEGDFYGLLVEFADGTFMFAVFYASDTEMFGRYWLLEEGETPTGNGDYFRGEADTMQASEQLLTEAGGSSQSKSTSGARQTVESVKQMQNLHQTLYRDSARENDPMFADTEVQNAYRKLYGKFQQNRNE